MTSPARRWSSRASWRPATRSGSSASHQVEVCPQWRCDVGRSRPSPRVCGGCSGEPQTYQRRGHEDPPVLFGRNPRGRSRSPDRRLWGLNDGPGTDYFERNYLTHGVADILLGSIYYPDRRYDHTLIGTVDPADLYTAIFDDFVDEINNRHLLLDHVVTSSCLVACCPRARTTRRCPRPS